MDLTKKKCVPCEGGVPSLTDFQAKEFLKQTLGWMLAVGKLSREFKFESFMKTIEFVNKVAEIAESENHHPDIYIYFKKVKLELYTHAINRLSRNDFIVATKVNEMKG